jgi:hypothetical protein
LPVTSLAHLTHKSKPLIITRSTNKTMSLIQKFKKDVSTLRLAANGEIYLDVKSPKLYKKVRRFYENEGVVFSGDPLTITKCLWSISPVILRLLKRDKGSSGT